MSDSSSERNPVELLAEEFLERYRRGERPALSEYTARYPEFAEEIRDLFPALVMMEDVRPGTGDVTGDLEPRPAGGQKLERLGDYRILREVGHGGMGIVYEAEQESLGRHVALKVLLTHSLLDPKQLQRFHREARAAARLHHTNIVPVYGVGEHGGFHYYIMQFIQGQGLDQVLGELKRLKEIQGGDGRAAEGSAAAAAQGLLTGRFTAGGKGGGETAGEANAPDGLLEGSEPARPGPSPTADSTSSSTIHLPGQTEHSALTHSSRQYFQSVARIGVQVAEALAYAHSQGILHRDIKPSNLLLDTQGTVWVTDFGLAKAAADGDLTHTGDIVGTLRYMAPERFNGQSDVRSDLYSLGLTLYELLTLRPAFDEANRNRLIQQVMHDEPPRPRRLNPAVPRDLETIVLKGITRDPAQRYQTPRELADDLRRFVEDRPIRARRAGAGERLWRWCRRNPALASMMAMVQIALLSLLGLGAWSYGRISQALTETEEARADAVRLRDEAVGVSYRALLNETQALRLAHASGWRHQALQNLRKLAQLETPQRDLVELRSEAVACLGGFDANEETRFLGHTTSIWSLDFSPDGALLATAGYDGRLQLWDVKERRSVREVLDPAVNLALRHTFSAPIPAVRFHPDGKSLAYATWDPGFGVVDVKEVARELGRVEFPAAARSLAFDKKGRLAVSWNDGRISLYDADTRTLQREIVTGMGNNSWSPVALSPDGELLAAMGPGHTVQIHALVGDKEPLSLGRHRGNVRSLCFSPSAHLVASGSEDGTAKLWHVGGGEEPITLLGHKARVNCVAFSPDGSLLASASDDETVRLWETQTGQALMVLQPGVGPALCVTFSPDGKRLAVGGVLARIPSAISLYQLTSRQEQRRLSGHTYKVNAVAFHPSQPLLASGSADKSILLWDLLTGRPIRRWDETRPNFTQRLAFAPDGGLLAAGIGAFITSAGRDYGIELQETMTGNRRRRLEGPETPIEGLVFDPTGKRLAAGTADGTAFLWDIGTGEVLHRWKGKGGGIDTAAFLDNGAHLVTADASGQVAIRDVATGQTVRETMVPGGLNCLAADPRESRLAGGSLDGTLHLLVLPGLETTATLEKAHAGKVVAVAFSPDHRLLASAGADLRVVLWDARTHQRLCTLAQTSEVLNLAFDAAGKHLAICGEETLVTVWDLGLVNEELAAVGLDWDASLPKTGLPPGELVDARPAPVTTVEARLQPLPQTGTASEPKSSAIVRPAERRRRAATAEEIAGWVRQLADADGKVRQAAADALVEAGPAAVPALETVAEQPQRRYQARAVRDRIAAAEVLAPTRVRLKLQNALPAEAIRSLSEQSHLPLEYLPPTDGSWPKRINLDLEDVPVWEALDRICEAADLGHSCTDRITVRVSRQAPRPPVVRGYAGPFRLNLAGGTYYRSLNPNLPQQVYESVLLRLGMIAEPNRGWLSIPGQLRVTEARGPDGQSRDLADVPRGYYPSVTNGGGVCTGMLSLPLKGADRRNDRLKLLKGVVPLEIMIRRQDLVTVPDLAGAAGRTYCGEQGYDVAVVQARTDGPQRMVHLRMVGPLGRRYEWNLYGVEISDSRGHSQRSTNLAWNASSPAFRPEDPLAWLATAPQAPLPAGLPWAALTFPGPLRQQWECHCWLNDSMPVPFEGPVTLRFYRFERMKVDLPFELHDVPLP